MCLCVYVASDRELRTDEWVKASPAFYLESITTRDEVVRSVFTLRHIYYAGSHEQCGCGFEKDYEEIDDIELRQSNYTGLSERISDVVSRGERIEIFTCWEGQQNRKPEIFGTKFLGQLTEPSFNFRTLEFLEITQ